LSKIDTRGKGVEKKRKVSERWWPNDGLARFIGRKINGGRTAA